jgi:hypothetical protein
MKSKTITIIAITLVGAMLALPATSHAWRGGWGWWGPGAFVGGVALGAAIAAPYYAPYYAPPPAYAYPAPQVIYTAPPPNQAYGYPSQPPPPNQAYANPGQPPPAETASAPQGQGKGQWVEVPGQMVQNKWVPPHRVWVPDN